MIYFIRRPDCNRIKIGTTIRLSQRLKQLVAEHGPGLEVLAVAEGSFEQERELHHRFGHLRDVGEWFEPGDDLVGFIVEAGREWDGSDDPSDSRHARIELPDDDYQRLKRTADRFRLSISAYIRLAVMERIERDEQRTGGR